VDSFAQIVSDELCPLCQEKARLMRTSEGPMCKECYSFELNNNPAFFEKEFVEE
jgi:hypothetical protein